jgi:CheY-like chemotaxis protein
VISPADVLKAKILIVDDQEANISLLEKMLRGAGYDSITSTTDPHQVCELHRKNRYSLILLDLRMGGMDGFQVMEGLKAIESDGYLPVLVQTAQPSHKLRALKAGAKDFVSKPFDLAEVLMRVHNMLEVRLLYRKAEVRTEQAEKSLAEFSTAPDQSSLPTKGSFRDISLPDLLQLFSASRNSCVLIIRTASRTGKVYLRAGQIYNAATDGRFWPRPQEALFEILSWSDGTFEIGPPDNGDVPTRISESITALLLEGMRRLDEMRLES